MNKSYYTYAYLRENKTPYYIGKGNKNRLYNSKRNCYLPKDKSRIIFLKQNLTEEEAFRHEIYMIAVFGRKDLRTGILRNMTDGGEGSSGAIRSLSFKENLRKINTGKKLTEEHKEKLKLANIGKNNPNYGKIASKETKNKMKISQLGENHHSSNWWKITYDNGLTVTICGLPTWAKDNGYSAGTIHLVYSGNRKKHKNIIKVEKIK